jgi:hypothetical protein
MAYDSLMVFTGNANPKLAADVVKRLNISLGRANVGRFSDGEVSVEILENVRGKTSSSCNRPAPDQRQPDGTAGHGRCAEARLGRPHHRRHPLFRLCPPGSPRRARRASDHRQGGGQHAADRPACTAC